MADGVWVTGDDEPVIEPDPLRVMVERGARRVYTKEAVDRKVAEARAAAIAEVRSAVDGLSSAHTHYPAHICASPACPAGMQAAVLAAIDRLAGEP